MNSASRKRGWGKRKWLNTLVFLLTSGFFAHYIYRHFSDIPSVEWGGEQILFFLLSVLLATAGIAVSGVVWLLLLRDCGCAITVRNAVALFSVAQFGKYLPGNVGQYVGRVYMAKEAGIPVQVTLRTLLLEVFWVASTASGLAVLGVVFFVGDSVVSANWRPDVPWLLLFAGAMLCAPWGGIYVVNRWLPSLANRLSGNGLIVPPRGGTAVSVAGLFLICFAILGLILKLEIEYLFGVSAGSVAQLTCLFAVVWLVGYLAPGAPAGLGVRESMMLLLFSPFLGAGVTAGVAIMLRITTSLADFVAFAAGLYLRRPKSRRPA